MFIVAEVLSRARQDFENLCFGFKERGMFCTQLLGSSQVLSSFAPVPDRSDEEHVELDLSH